MNLQNRLAKLENKTNVKSKICGCLKPRVEIYIQASVDAEPELSSLPIDPICRDCRKPVEIERITIVGV